MMTLEQHKKALFCTSFTLPPSSLMPSKPLLLMQLTIQKYPYKLGDTNSSCDHTQKLGDTYQFKCSMEDI